MKKKILIIADSPLVPSGVGTQTRYMIESLLSTGEYQFLCLAGAIKHENYNIQKVEGYEEDWTIVPVDGYGNAAIVRGAIKEFKPDVLWFMTDPRFYHWLWQIEDEIRDKIPMVYYHVWDNYPYPTYNAQYYGSNDLICSISKVTDDIVKTVSPDTTSIHIPHAVDTDVFKNTKQLLDSSLRENITDNKPEKLVFFWNNRNARRKQSGTLIYWFKEFLDEVGHDSACLLMHTEPKDPHGQDLVAIIEELGLTNGEISFSVQKLPPEDLANIYSVVDCTINIADAEGFGLSTLESLSCETPIIVNMTGGLQEQVTDGQNWFGIGLEPASRSIIGSQEVPFIYEDRVSKSDFLNAMRKMFHMTDQERADLGRLGRQHVLNNYSLEIYKQNWIKTFKMIEEKFGSWESRNNYQSWKLMEVA